MFGASLTGNYKLEVQHLVTSYSVKIPARISETLKQIHKKTTDFASTSGSKSVILIF